MSTSQLTRALAEAGIDASVEGQGRVAILTAATASLDSGSRRRIVALAREHGFANVALELAPGAGHPERSEGSAFHKQQADPSLRSG